MMMTEKAIIKIRRVAQLAFGRLENVFIQILLNKIERVTDMNLKYKKGLTETQEKFPDLR